MNFLHIKYELESKKIWRYKFVKWHILLWKMHFLECHILLTNHIHDWIVIILIKRHVKKHSTTCLIGSCLLSFFQYYFGTICFFKYVHFPGKHMLSTERHEPAWSFMSRKFVLRTLHCIWVLNKIFHAELLR